MAAAARAQASGIASLIGVSCGADSKWCRGDAQAQLVDFCIVNPVRDNRLAINRPTRWPRVDAQQRADAHPQLHGNTLARGAKEREWSSQSRGESHSLRSLLLHSEHSVPLPL